MLRDRFEAPLDPRAAAFSASTREDAILLPYDLWGSIAHARMLGATGLVPRRTAARLEAGLRRLGDRDSAGRFPLDPSLEDVHLNVETALIRALGPAGERLHTGRSRNDQVAVDLALYLRDALRALQDASTAVAEALRAAARGPEGRGVVDGWTHLQPAQAVYWAQLLGTHALRFVRDAERFEALRVGLAESPLGAGALAGSSLPLDRSMTARLLGFSRPSSSSIDSVSDRDALAETVFASVLFGIHASALGEEIVLGSMEGVGRISLDDRFVTTSSLMPHKRNPDLAELVRAEAGPAIGRLAGLLGVLKGLPIGYQRDLQATKPIVLEAVERALGIASVLAPMIASARFRPDPPRAGRSTASVELADALVLQGVPFRSAHARVARFVSRCERAGTGLSDLPPSALEAEFPELEGLGFTLPGSREEPERRRTRGGSARAEVEVLLQEVGARIRSSRRSLVREERRLRKVRRRLGIPDGWRFVRPLGSEAGLRSRRPLPGGSSGSPGPRRPAPGRTRRAGSPPGAASSAPGP